MNNRHLYKARRTDNGEWVEGTPIKTHIGLFISFEENPHYCSQHGYMKIDEIVMVDENTLCQCTGVKDKYCTLIWENDIISIPNDEEPYLVVWDRHKAKWSMKQCGCFLYDFNDYWSEVEVIGSAICNHEAEQALKEMEGNE